MFPVASIETACGNDRFNLYIVRTSENTYAVAAVYNSTGRIYRNDLITDLPSYKAAIDEIEDSYSDAQWDLTWL